MLLTQHIDKRVFGLVIDFGTSQSPKSTRPLTTYLCPSRPGHQALRNNFASSLLLRTCLPMTGRRVRRPTLFSLWRKARRENSAASRLLGTTNLRFALHGWQRLKPSGHPKWWGVCLPGVVRYLCLLTFMHPLVTPLMMEKPVFVGRTSVRHFPSGSCCRAEARPTVIARICVVPNPIKSIT